MTSQCKMVATRRSVRVYSPGKTDQDQSSNVQATPSTGRTTRSTAKKVENPTQHASVETCSQLDKVEGCQSPTSSLKRCTRASRLHSPKQLCTPVGSIHEADTSDVESCCSGESDIQPPLTGTTRRRRRQALIILEDDDISEVESCSSAVSAPSVGRSSRQRLRSNKIPEGSDAPHLEAGDTKVELVPEAESWSSVPAEFQRVTRSQRKTARTRSSAKPQTDSELSDTDSYMSGVSGSEFSKSTSRRVTRSRKQTGPIPIHLDEASESSLSPDPTSRTSRAARGRKAAILDVSESQSCDSEGLESGPSHSMATRRQGKTKSSLTDSEFELTSPHSPMGTQSRGTPCGSREGSGNSAPGTPSSRRSPRYLKIVLGQAEEPAEKDTSLNSSTLESTVIVLDGDRTLLEEQESQTLDGRENDDVTGIDPTSNEADTIGVEKAVNVLSEEETLLSDMPLDIPACEEAAGKSAASVDHLQGELGDDGNTSEAEVMQETILYSEPLEPGQSVTLCERTPDPAEETGEKGNAMDAADVDTHPSPRDEAVEEEDVQQNLPGEQEEMQAGASCSDAQRVDTSNDAQVESIQVTSSPQRNIVDSGPEQQPEEDVVQNTNMISLLESSEDEEEEEEEMEVSNDEGEGDLVDMPEDGGRPSNKSEAAGSSIDGLFMIDTRPGEEADELYYMEKPTEETKATKEKKVEEEEGQDDEFVDEEGDDDDDEDTNILFASRNPLLKEMSCRIDPGMRVKELGGLYINFDGSKAKHVSSSLQKKEKKIQDEVMKKSVIGPDFEKRDAVPPYSETKRTLKLKHREEREKSTGDGWFNMKAPEISQELKGDLKLLKMRGSLDPKRFYKKNDRDGFSKFFQVGTVVDNPVDFYHSRIPKKERKRTMVEELLADADFRHNNKKKFHQIIVEKAAQGAGKRNKKRNKVHKK